MHLVKQGGNYYYKKLFRITIGDSQEKLAMATGVKEKPNPPQDSNSQDTSQA
jgi:hypothetical protein